MIAAPITRSNWRRRRRSDQEFLAPALEILETPPSPVRVALIWLICALVAIALAWAYMGRIDIIAVAQGKIQPTGRVKVIEPLETGRVLNVLAINGAYVKDGDVLVNLDRSEAIADQTAAAAVLEALRAEAVRRLAAMKAAKAGNFEAPEVVWPSEVPGALREREELVLAADLSQLRATLASLEGQQRQKQIECDKLKQTVESQKRLIATLQERVDMRSFLVKLRSGAKAAVIDATESLQYQQTQLAMQEGHLASDEASMEVIVRDENKVLQTFISENAQKLNESRRQAEDVEQRLAKAVAKTEHMTLKAPITGIVQASTITNIGQVITTGQEIMRIVPKDAVLEIEVYVLNRDIGFIKSGQAAVVKIESFPFTRYGTIAANVNRIAGDAIPEPDATQIEGDSSKAQSNFGFAGAQRTQNLVFPVTLSLDTNYILADGLTVPLTPGMATTVEIKTGSRRILEYIFSPLVGVVSEAMRER